MAATNVGNKPGMDSVALDGCSCQEQPLAALDVRFVSIVSRLGPDTLYLIVSRARFIEFRQLCISGTPTELVLADEGSAVTNRGHVASEALWRRMILTASTSTMDVMVSNMCVM